MFVEYFFSNGIENVHSNIDVRCSHNGQPIYLFEIFVHYIWVVGFIVATLLSF